MNKNIYYDGTKLLSLKDLQGRNPEIIMCTTNRTGGKTTFFSRLLVNRWLKDHANKFMLLYRFNYDLDNVAEKFFKDIHGLFFKDHIMSSERRMKGTYHNLFIDEEHCGYAVAINSADTIKTISHLFSDTNSMFFDEFQSESGHYCPQEITKFRSIHTSVARGNFKQTRYVPVYMCSNTITILNPYFTALNVCSRLQHNTKYLRGNGYVLEQGFVEHAAKALLESPFNQAFGENDRYTLYQAEGLYLNDNYALIQKPAGRGKYLYTIVYKNEMYGIIEYPKQGLVYVTSKADSTSALKLCLTTNDMRINYVMLSHYKGLIDNLRNLFKLGCFRFQNLKCKDMTINLLSL